MDSSYLKMEALALGTPLPPSPQHNKIATPPAQRDNLTEVVHVEDVNPTTQSPQSTPTAASTPSGQGTSQEFQLSSSAGSPLSSGDENGKDQASTPLVVGRNDVCPLANIPRASSNSDLIGSAEGSAGSNGKDLSSSPITSPALLSPTPPGGRSGIPYYNPLSPQSAITPGSLYVSSPGSYGVPVKSVAFLGQLGVDQGGRVRIREDLNIVREVSSIFDRQAVLGLPEHLPEPVGNPFRPWEDPSMYGHYKHRYGEVTGQFPHNATNPNLTPSPNQQVAVQPSPSAKPSPATSHNPANANPSTSALSACPPLPGLPKAHAKSSTTKGSSSARQGSQSAQTTPRGGPTVISNHRGSLPLISVPVSAPGYSHGPGSNTATNTAVVSKPSVCAGKDTKDNVVEGQQTKAKRRIPLAKLWPFGLMSRRHSK